MDQSNDVLKDVFNDFLKTTTATPQPPIEDLGEPVVPSTVNKGDQLALPLETPAGQAPDVSEPAPIEQTPSVVADSEEVSWDSLLEDTPAPETPTMSGIDWKEIGKAIGLPSEVKGVEDVQNYVKSLEKTVEDLKAKPTFDDKTPKELVEALEIHKNGGDYLAYLEVATEDYSNVDPVELFEDEVAELFYNQDGSFREAEYYNYIDSINPADKMLRGRQIQRELLSMQAQKKQEIQQRTIAEKQESLRRLESSLNNFKGVGTFEATPKVKKQMFDELATGKFLDSLGVSPNGTHNWDKLLDSYFKAKYFDTVQQYHAKKAERTTQRAILNSTTNSSVNRSGNLSNAAATPAPKSGVDLYLERINKR